MKNRYNRPEITLDYWIVSMEDLQKIYDFFLSRFKTSRVDIEIDVESGNNKSYKNFRDFLDDIKRIVSLKEQIKSIKIIHSELINIEEKSLHPISSKIIWVEINFVFDKACFNIVGEDNNGIVRDWIAGTYEEMKRLFSSFRVDENFIDILKNNYGKKHRNGVIVFDYDGEIKNRISNEIKNLNTIKIEEINGKEKSKKRWWEQGWIQLIMLISAFVSIVGFLFILFPNLFK